MVKEKINMNKYKTKEKCACCGRENTRVSWLEDVNGVLVDNDYYLCHWCGFYHREYGGSTVIDGITFDPKKVPLRRQLSAIRKHRQNYEGLIISNHRGYKPPKESTDEPAQNRNE